MSMNSNRELHDNDASLQEGHTIPERVENFGGNVVTMNGDLEEGSQGQLFICHQEEDANPLRQRERKRSVHNSMEKKRKEKIRYFINKIGELLPPVDNVEKEKIGRSTLDIVEKAYDYIQELKVTVSRLQAENTDNVEEVGKIKSELTALKRERDRYAEQLQQTGRAFVETPDQWGQKLDPSDPSTGAEAPLNGLGGQGTVAEPPSPTPMLENAADIKPKGNKKKRNTISLQLEMKKQQQSQSAELSNQAMAGNYGNVAMNNMMMNQMVFGNSQMMMQQHMMGVGGQMPGGGQGQSVESSAAELAGAGLIQLAMQDAGITPSTSVTSDENLTSTATQASSDPIASASDNSALETLASIATVPQTAGVVGSSAPVSQAAVSPLVSQSGSAMTATTQAINANMPIMATGQSGIGQIQPNNNMMNVPFVNGGQQQFPPGILQGQQSGFNTGIPTPQQQIMFINEQGVPCIANVPLGIDHNSLGIPNFQKQVVGMDKSGNIGLQGFGNVMVQKDQGMTADQTLITNMNLQGQQTFQQTQGAVAMGASGMVQPPMPLSQQVMQPMHQLAGGLGNQGQQGLIMPVSQSGNLLINSTNQNQGPPGNQLPQALLLPNGQIIPVVANPQTGVNNGSGVIQANTQWQGGSLQGGGIQQQGAPQANLAVSGAPPRMSLPPGIQGSMMTTGMDGTIISGGPNPGTMASSTGQIQVGQPQVAFSHQSSNMGLLMTTASNLPGTNAVANSSVSQPLSEAGQTGNVIDSVATNKGKTCSVTACGPGQQSGMTDTKQNMLRFHDSDLPDQARGSQIMMKSTGPAGVFPPVSGSDNLTMPTTSGPPGNSGMPMGMPAPPSGGMGAGANGPILLTMNLNGQPTSVLVDPTTMQVLGTVQNPQQSVQQAPPQSVAGQQVQVAGQQVTSQQVTGQQVTGQQVTGQSMQVTPPGNSTTSKKSKKNSQRAICPKPSAKNKSGRNTECQMFGNEDEDQTDLPTQPATTTKKSKSKKSKATKAATVVATSAAAESGVQDESATDTTDILAKAAESIFSSDISPPIGGFYNPANEDNPLQIDTSAGETEEDPEGGRTPRKEPDVGKGPTDTGIQQVKQLHNDRPDILGTGQALSHQEVSDVLGVDIMMTSRGPEDILANMSTATSIQSELANLATDKPTVDLDSSSGVFSPPSIIDPPKKSNKKSKKAEKEKGNTPEKTKVKATEDEIQNTVKEIMNSVKNNTPPPPAKKSGKKSKKMPSIEKPMTTSTKIMECVEAEPVIAFPDTIIFSEKELSDVLDQVENLGSSLSDSSQTVTPPKKSKSKKSKGDNLISDSEPASKKQKKGSARDKNKSSALTENVGSKSSMSVYDFEEDGQEEFSSPLRSLQTKRNSSSINNAPVSSDQFMKSATAAPIGISSVSPMRVGENLPFSSRVCSSEGRLFSSPNQLTFSSSPRDTSPGFADDSITERPLFDTQLPLPTKEKKSKKRSKSKKANKSQSPATAVRNLPENDILLESQKQSTVPEKTISSVQSLVPVNRFEGSDFDEFESGSKKKEDDIEKMDIDLLEKSPEHSTPKKDSSECLGLRTSTTDSGLLSCVQNSVIMDEHLSASVPHRDLDSSHRDTSPPNSLSDPVALTDPVHISTHSLASSENSDIDNTMNSILGLSAAAALSPHIISPGQQQPVHHVRVSSPQLQTPKSASPVSLTSPQQQSLQHSVLMSVASTDPLVSCASSVTSCSSMTNFSSPGDLPYSAESLFNPSSDKATLSSATKPTTLAISRQDSEKSNHGLFEKSQMGSKARNGIYSADNFVQTNKDEGLRTDKSTNQVNVISPPLSSSLNRIGNENSSDVFNFATIGLNLATPTTSTTSIMDSLNMSPIISTIANTSVTSSSFTFTLSSVTSTLTTSSAGMTSHDNHQSVQSYPFYSPQSHQHLPSSSSSSNMQNVSNLLSNSNNQQQEQQQQPSLTMPNFDIDLGNSVNSHLGHQQKRSSNDTVAQSHIQSSQSQLFYGMSSGNRASCSVQNQQREPQEQPPMIPNITVSSHNPISKSQSEQIHNTHKRMQELGQGPVRSGPPPAKASNSDHRGSDLGAMERQFNIKPSNSDPRGNDLNAMERQFNLKSSAQDPRTNDLSTMDRQFNIKSTNPDPRTNDLSTMERQFNIKSTNPDPRGNELANMERQQFSMNNVQPFFPPSNFSNAGSQSMNTHPLRHPPLNSMEERSGMPGARAYEPIFSPHTQGFNPSSQGFGGSRYDSNVMFPHQRESSGVVGNQPLSHTPPIQTDGRKSANSQSSSAKSNKQNSSQQSQHPVAQQQQQQQPRSMSGPPPHTVPTPPHHPPTHRPTPPQAGSQPPQPHQSQVSNSRQQKSSSASRSKQSQKKSKQQQQLYSEMETSFPHAMFEANRSLTPFFGLTPQNLSPPARNMQNEGPGLFAANLFGAGPRHTATASMPKNAEISAPYNPLFPPGRPQNGLGLNFQPGFGMNTVHGGMSNAPSITPHSGSVTVTPHMSNFSLTNIFSDVNNSSQNDLNISPIKFPHSNSIMPHQGMDPNALQHPHHQGGSIYHPHNRSHPPPPVLHNAMSINSILGQHHHSFDTRGVPQGMNASAPPFHGPGHPPSFALPPLNFSMHDP